jgi:hypothetical protein
MRSGGKRRRGRMDRLGGFTHSLLPLEGGALPQLTVTGQEPFSKGRISLRKEFRNPIFYINNSVNFFTALKSIS